MIIEHVGIAVRSIEDGVRLYRDCLGLDVAGYEEVREQGVRIAMLPIGESRIELIEPLDENSPIEKFLARRGPGIHHIAIRVSDILAALERLRGAGARLIDESPRPGADGTRVAFIHPSSMNGVLVELVEHAE